MKPKIIFVDTLTTSENIISSIKSLCKDNEDTVLVLVKSEHNFSEIPKLTVGEEFNEKYSDPECYEELPPEKTCPPYEWGQNGKNGKKKHKRKR